MLLNTDKDVNARIRRQKVLVIDDNLDSVKLMTHILDQQKCDIAMAFDGEDSIPLLARESFDLVVIDWNMPVMNGRETLLMLDRLLDQRTIRLRGHNKLPIIIYSAHEDRDLDLPHCEHLEIIGYIHKQQSFSSIMKHCRNLMTDLAKTENRAA